MNAIVKFAAILFVSVLFAGCDQLSNKAGAKLLKVSLKANCGDEDTDCIAAVENQFDSCQSNYEKEWNDYMNASASKEDELLEIYSLKMCGCIVDENGEPYFEYNPE